MWKIERLILTFASMYIISKPFVVTFTMLKCLAKYIKSTWTASIWLYVDDGAQAVERTDHCLNGLSSDLAIEQTFMCSFKSRLDTWTGFDRICSSTIGVYFANLCSNPWCNDTSPTEKITHIRRTCARKDRDMSDLNKLLDRFETHNPFVTHSTDLLSLSIGLTTKEGGGVNCDAAKEVGFDLQ